MSDAPPTPSLLRRVLFRWKWVAALLIALPLVAWPVLIYFGEKAAEHLRLKLAQKGLAIEWSSARITPGPGIHFTALQIGSLHQQQPGNLLLWEEVTVKRGPDGWNSIRIQDENGTIHVGDGTDRMVLDALQLDLEASTQRVRAETFSLTTGGVEVEVTLDIDLRHLSPASAPTQAEAKSPPGSSTHLQATLSAVLREVKTWADFTGGKNRPKLHLHARTISESPGVFLTASLHGRDIQWRGVPLPGIAMQVDWKSGSPATPILIRRFSTDPDAETDHADALLNLETKLLDIRKLDTHLDLLQLTRAAMPKESRKALDVLNASGPVRLQAQGKVPLGAMHTADVSGRVEGPAQLNIMLGEGRSIPVLNPAGRWRLKGHSLTITDHGAELWGGKVSTKTMRIDWSAAPRFEGDTAITGLQTPAMLKSLGQTAVLPGTLSATFRGEGGITLAQVTGGGTVNLRNAAFYRIPLLGPLSMVFDKLAPGFARDTASDLDARYSLAGGIVTIQNAELKSKLTEVSAQGRVDLIKQYGELQGKARLRGIVGLSTALLSELLTVEGKGPLNDMRWSLKNLPGVAEITGAAGKVGGAVTDVVKDVGGTASQAVGTAAKEAGKAAKKILGLPGKLLPGGKPKEE